MKTDKESKSKKQLIDAFRELLQDKPFSKITVDDIVTKAGLSRQSFYRSFYDKYGILFCIYKDAIDNIRKRYATNDIMGSGAETIAYLKENAQIYKELGCDFGSPNPFMNAWMTYSRQHLVDNIGERNITHEVDIAIKFYLHACWFIHYEYMVGHLEGPASEIVKITKKNMPNVLRPYFPEHRALNPEDYFMWQPRR